MHIAILDDEEIYRRIISNIVKKYNEDIKITCFKEPDELLCDSTAFDILLLDIEMPNMDGITFAQKYVSSFPKVIFITSHEECVFDAFNLNILGFVVKKRMNIELIEQLQTFEARELQKVEVNTFYGTKEYDMNEILYFVIEHKEIYMKLHKHSVVLKELSLNKLMDKLDENDYIFIDRTCIVNRNHITQTLKAAHQIIMSDGKHLNVSRRNWSVALQALLDRTTS